MYWRAFNEPTMQVLYAIKTDEWSKKRERHREGKKRRRLRATVRWGKGARKLFRYETHRAAYRVKGANLKKPLPRLSAPRCGGIKIQKEESGKGVGTAWGAEGTNRGERATRHECEKGGSGRVRGIGKLPCNLSHRHFELLLRPLPPCEFLLSFSRVVAWTRKKEVPKTRWRTRKIA